VAGVRRLGLATMMAALESTKLALMQRRANLE
jgi:hypothetical protein